MLDQLEQYKQHQAALVAEHNGKILAVKDGACLGEFETYLDALDFVDLKGFKEGEYIVLRCTPGTEEYTGYFANAGLL